MTYKQIKETTQEQQRRVPVITIVGLTAVMSATKIEEHYTHAATDTDTPYGMHPKAAKQQSKWTHIRPDNTALFA